MFTQNLQEQPAATIRSANISPGLADGRYRGMRIGYGRLISGPCLGASIGGTIFLVDEPRAFERLRPRVLAVPPAFVGARTFGGSLVDLRSARVIDGHPIDLLPSG
jgi:hypothetical protein